MRRFTIYYACDSVTLLPYTVLFNTVGARAVIGLWSASPSQPTEFHNAQWTHYEPYRNYLREQMPDFVMIIHVNSLYKATETLHWCTYSCVVLSSIMP